ncbi:MAG: hypothetical protein ACRDOM_01745, partial [Nocardioides sp.]
PRFSTAAATGVAAGPAPRQGRRMDREQEKRIAELLEQQAGVIARRQVLRHGGRPADLERMLRRRELVRLLPAVFLHHTGEPTWLQRAWAGVLYYGDAALAHDSALRAAAGPGWRKHDDSGRIHIAVDEDRHVRQLEGYRLHRLIRLEDRVRWNTSPPRMKVEEAALDVAAARPTEFGAIEVLADVCQQRRTTAARMLLALEGRGRLRRRDWLRDVLTDIAAGTCSVLEHGYLDRVERPHGLPGPGRQSTGRSDRGPLYRDVDHAEFDLYVELDGRLFHDTAGQRDQDLDRDLDAAVDGRRTVRLGWGQVFDRSCGTAGRIARLLQQRGWDGSPVACGPACTIWTDNPVSATRQAR